MAIRSSPPRTTDERPRFPGRAVSVFFPMYDEEENVEPTVRKAFEVLPELIDEFELIVVDDGSRDRTAEIADRLAREHPEVRVVHHETNRGYGAAVKSGIAAARHELVFFTDGDLQFDLQEIELLLERIDRYDAVVGYRKRRNDPFHRSVNTFLWNRLVALAFGLRMRDVDCAFKLFRSEALRALPPLSTGGAILSTELMVQLQRSGARFTEVGVNHYPRRRGEQSGASLRVIARAFKELFQLSRRIGRRRYGSR